MPIKKLAQLILATEGFLLLTAIVVSTSYQLSRKGVTETRSRAAVSQPRCNAFSLTLPAGRVGGVLKTDPISISINASAATAGSALFADSRPIVLSAFRVRDGVSHDFLDYGGEPSHCEGKATCVKADRGFTFEHAGITEAGEYKIYPFMTNSEGGTCTDKPGAPVANQCGCGARELTLIEVGVPPGVTCDGFQVLKAEAVVTQIQPGDNLTLKAMGVSFPASVNFFKGVFFGWVKKPVAASSAAGYIGSGTDAGGGVWQINWRVGSLSAGDYYLFAVPVGITRTVSGYQDYACSPFTLPASLTESITAALPGGTSLSAIPVCPGCKSGVSVSEAAVGPRCTSLSLSPTSGTKETDFTARLNCTSGSTPFARVYLLGWKEGMSQSINLTVTATGLCYGQTTCNTSHTFKPSRVNITADGTYNTWIAIRTPGPDGQLGTADDGRCTDAPPSAPGAADRQGVPACGAGVKTFTLTAAPLPSHLTFKMRDEDGTIIQPGGRTTDFACGTTDPSNDKPLFFQVVANYPVSAASSAKNGVDRIELRWRMKGEGTWRGLAFYECPKAWNPAKGSLVGPETCRLMNTEWWRWLPREFYRGENRHEFLAKAYAVGVGEFATEMIGEVLCKAPPSSPRPPAVVADPECVSFELSSAQVTINTPVQVKVKARCVGGTCTDLAKEGIRDFHFFQKKGEAQWLWAGSKSCYLSWPLHKVCFTGTTKASCKASDTECNAGTFNWVPTAVGTYQLQARVSNNAGRQVMCGPKTVTVTAAGGAALPQSWWQKLVATVQGWVASLVPPALAQEATAPLKVIFKLDDAPHSLLGRVVTVGVLNLEEGYNLVAVPRGEGIYEATVNLPADEAGSARIGVKPAGYLQRVKEAMLVAGQTTTVDFGQTKFLGGDLNEDNKLTIADLAEELLPQFSEVNELSVPLDDDNRFMDLNDDGIINVLDISIVLKNLTELEVRGEE